MWFFHAGIILHNIVMREGKREREMERGKGEINREKERKWRAKRKERKRGSAYNT